MRGEWNEIMSEALCKELSVTYETGYGDYTVMLNPLAIQAGRDIVEGIARGIRPGGRPRPPRRIARRRHRKALKRK